MLSFELRAVDWEEKINFCEFLNQPAAELETSLKIGGLFIFKMCSDQININLQCLKLNAIKNSKIEKKIHK